MLESDGIAVVLIDATDPHLPHVSIDDEAAGRLSGEHLLAAGHRRVGFVGFPESSPLGMTSGARRRRGLAGALSAADATLPDAYVKLGASGRVTAGRVTAELLALDRPPTAIFAESDVLASGVISAVERAQLSVPRDVSVIGFDDLGLAEAIGLTTVRQPLRESGRRGTELLLHALEPDHQPVLAGLPALEIVERRTVAPPAVTGRDRPSPGRDRRGARGSGAQAR
jgi:DNA-binding LacI/PurR family transcriptional regulator